MSILSKKYISKLCTSMSLHSTSFRWWLVTFMTAKDILLTIQMMIQNLIGIAVWHRSEDDFLCFNVWLEPPEVFGKEKALKILKFALHFDLSDTLPPPTNPRSQCPKTQPPTRMSRFGRSRNWSRACRRPEEMARPWFRSSFHPEIRWVSLTL